MELKHVTLNTPLRGARNYVHSTSLYNELLDYTQSKISTEAWIQQLKLNQFTNKKCLATTTLDDDDETLGSFSIVVGKEIISGYVVTKEGNANPILLQEEYDEDAICINANTNFEKESVNSSWNKEVSFIDQCVALTKHFHNQLFVLEEKKWIYTRLTLNQDINQLSPQLISIAIKRKLGNRITQSNIFLDENLVGIIEFSVK